MSFGLYLGGFLIAIAGLIYAAVLLHVAPQWIGAGAMVLVGLAILKGVQATPPKIRPLKSEFAQLEVAQKGQI